MITQLPWDVLDFDVIEATGDSTVGVVYLPGWGEDKRSLGGFATATVPNGGQALLPTLRGQGPGPRPSGRYAPADFAADLQRTFSARSAVHVVGYSFGALIALSYAVNVGPSRVASVTLIDQAFFADLSRRVTGEWAEASAMKWEYDYTHQVFGATAVGIDVLMILADESSVVSPVEKDFWLAQDIDRLRVRQVPGDHRSLVRDRANAVEPTRAFLSEVNDREKN